MGKYIALEGAKVAVINTEAVFEVGTAYAEPYQKTIDVMKALDNLTAIDIVRCKDCKQCKPLSRTYLQVVGKNFIDKKRCDKFGLVVSDDDYCSFAESKGSDNE